MWKKHMMLVALVKIVVASQHKRQRKKIFLKMRNENTDSDLKASARAALCKWATRTRQTCLSKNFCKLGNCQNRSWLWYKHCLGNSQINSIPAWSKEFSYITFLYRTNAKVYAYNCSEQIFIYAHSVKLKKFSTLKTHLSINWEHKST